MTAPTVLSVSLSPVHSFSKHPAPSIRLLSGRGVEGDAHCGAEVRHRYLRRRNPLAPNLTQVHFLASEFLADLTCLGFAAAPGALGENLTTAGIDLLSLPTGALLHLGPEASVEVTGLRQPCTQLDQLQPGLLAACFHPGPRSARQARAGIMGIVLAGGNVRPGDPIRVELPPPPHLPLRFV